MYDIRGTSHGSDRSDTIGSGSVLDEDIFLNMRIVVKVHDAGKAFAYFSHRLADETLAQGISSIKVNSPSKDMRFFF